MRFPVWLLCFALVVVGSAGADAGTVRVPMGTQITKVDVARQRATIGRGAKAGVRVGEIGELYAMRGSPKPTVSYEERVARGKVVEVQDHTAVIALDAIADTVEVGAYFLYSADAPEELARSSLFNIVARGIELQLQAETTNNLVITVEQMFADPSPALRDKALDAMIDEMKVNKAFFEKALPPITGGKHHGKLAGKVIDELTRGELLDCFLYAEGYHSEYDNKRWKVPELYFGWVIGNTPGGERERTLRLLQPTIDAAKANARIGKLDDARTQWETALRAIPDLKQARDEVDRIYRLQLWMRQLVTDPDNTSVRSQLAYELYAIGAFAIGLVHVDWLVKAKYEPFDSANYRAKLLAKLERWREAEIEFKRLAKLQPDNKNVQDWIEYVAIKGRLVSAANDPTAHMALAQHAYRREEWDWALQEFRGVLEAKGVTNAQRGTVKRAQQRIAIHKKLALRLDWVREAIKRHEIPTARRQLEESLKLMALLGEPTRTVTVLADLASTAHMSAEGDLQLDLLERRAQLTTDDTAIYALAFALNSAGRHDDAIKAARKATKVDPYLFAFVARARGDLGEVEKLARQVSQAEPKSYVWPWLMLAAVEAARGHWQEAIEHARKAQILDGADVSVRTTLNACLRGLQAHEALQANPSSARERLRLVRALANLRLVKPASAEIAKLPADGTWRGEGWWAITASEDYSIPLADQLMAARNAKPNTPSRKRFLAKLEAETKLAAQPKDDVTRATLARLYLQSGNPNGTLAVLSPLLVAPVKPAVANLANDAREALEMAHQGAAVDEATRLKDYAGAMRLALARQAVADRTGEVLGQAAARESRMNVLVAQGRYAEAITVVQEANVLQAADGDAWLTVIGDWHLAQLQAQLGTNDVYRRSLAAGLKVCDDMDNDKCLFGAHRELGRVAMDDGRTADGIDHARAAWTLADRLGQTGWARAAQLQLANLDLAADRTADAELLLIKLLADSRKAVDTDDEQKALLMLGIVASRRGQGKVARARYQEVYDLGTRLGYLPWRAIARKLEGAAWLNADHDPTKAEPALEHAATLLDGATDTWSIEVRTSALRELAHARLELGKLASARRNAEQALALERKYERRSSLASSHALLAKIALAEGSAGLALASAKTALELAKQTDESELLADTWHRLAQAHVLSKQDGEAADAFDKALESRARTLLAVGGESERDSFLGTSDVRDLYIDAVEHYLKLGKTTRAMEVLELSRDAQLKQAFDPATVATADPKLKARLAVYETERAQVKALQKQLEDAANKPGAQRSASQVQVLADLVAKGEQKLKTVAADLKGSHNALYRMMSVDPQSLMDRRTQLPTGAVIVEYFTADDGLYAFVIAAALKQPAVVRVKVTSAELTKTVTEFRGALVQEAEKVKARDKVEALGRKLEDWLLQPLRKHLDGASTVIVVPFGILHYVPFDALVVSEPGKPLRYAIEDFRFSVQTAMTIERLLEPARPRATGTLLAISNPDGSLPGAQREVAKIVKSIPDARVLTRKDATLKKFSDVVGGFRYVHVASHGILDPDPWKSYLKLADANLTVSHIAKLGGLRTSTELVVLSACESATAQGASSADDLMSLAGGFAWAGAPAIVASLWEVDDDSTGELMATFYRALEANAGDRLDSLRNAKLNLLRYKQGKTAPYAAPWHWSSFQLYGDFRAPATR